MSLKLRSLGWAGWVQKGPKQETDNEGSTRVKTYMVCLLSLREPAVNPDCFNIAMQPPCPTTTRTLRPPISYTNVQLSSSPWPSKAQSGQILNRPLTHLPGRKQAVGEPVYCTSEDNQWLTLKWDPMKAREETTLIDTAHAVRGLFVLRVHTFFSSTIIHFRKELILVSISGRTYVYFSNIHRRAKEWHHLHK
jgi:hypothetical protein